MGDSAGRQADALTFFAELAAAPYRYDFYQTLRRLECLFDEKPRWGRIGVELHDGHWPGLFFGFLLDGADHALTLIAPDTSIRSRPGIRTGW